VESDHPFRIRAYLESSRIQYRQRNRGINVARPGDWSSAFRRAFTAFKRGESEPRKFDSWGLAFNRTKRALRCERPAWRVRIANQGCDAKAT
jgi:hypothetical protein